MRELDNLYHALGEFRRRIQGRPDANSAAMRGLGEHFNDPRDFANEATPLPIDGNVIDPVLDEKGCVIDPRYGRDDCPSVDLMKQRGGIFPWSPLPGSKGFVQTTLNGVISVPTGGYASSAGAILLTLPIPNGFIGKLMEFGFEIENHSTNFDDIVIKMMVSDQAEPLLTLNPFYKPTFEHRVPFYLEIPPNRILSIVAFNFGGAPLNVGAIAVGYTEPFFA